MGDFDTITASDIRAAQARARVERAAAVSGMLAGIGGVFRRRAGGKRRGGQAR